MKGFFFLPLLLHLLSRSSCIDVKVIDVIKFIEEWEVKKRRKGTWRKERCAHFTPIFTLLSPHVSLFFSKLKEYYEKSKLDDEFSDEIYGVRLHIFYFAFITFVKMSEIVFYEMCSAILTSKNCLRDFSFSFHSRLFEFFTGHLRTGLTLSVSQLSSWLNWLTRLLVSVLVSWVCDWRFDSEQRL